MSQPGGGRGRGSPTRILLSISISVFASCSTSTRRRCVRIYLSSSATSTTLTIQYASTHQLNPGQWKQVSSESQEFARMNKPNMLEPSNAILTLVQTIHMQYVKHVLLLHQVHTNGLAWKTYMERKVTWLSKISNGSWISGTKYHSLNSNFNTPTLTK